MNQINKQIDTIFAQQEQVFGELNQMFIDKVQEKIHSEDLYTIVKNIAEGHPDALGVEIRQLAQAARLSGELMGTLDDLRTKIQPVVANEKIFGNQN